MVTVVFNGAKHLEQCITSVINQTYSNVEYIVIDGGSTDGTLDIIRRYENKISYWISEPDKGIFDAMNKGIKKANGDFIGILNADDWYEADIVTRMVDEITGIQNPSEYGSLVFYCNYYHFDEELRTESKVRKYSTKKKYWRGMSILHQSMFISKGIYNKLGVYDLTYRSASDYDFFLRMIRNGIKFVGLDVHGVNFRRGGYSTMNMNESLREASKINQLYFGFFSLKHLSFVFLHYIFSLPGNIKLLLYKYLGREKTAKLRRLWKSLKAGVQETKDK